MESKLKSIHNIPFLVCLVLLFLNDFYFKFEYHNWLTGKLSDFCGLFVFARFWTACFPDKKQTIYFSTAITFIIWKSPYSQGFIDFFSNNFFTIHRVVDYTDLIALSILPISYFYKPRKSFELRYSHIPLAIITLISFCATTIPEPSQTFSQPQYLLFKTENTDFQVKEYWNDYIVHKLDSFTIVEVKSIRIDKEASLDDDFHKTKILKDLDLLLLRELGRGDNFKNELGEYKQLRDSLIFSGKVSVLLPLESYVDSLNFKNSRLDGVFKRYSKTNQLLISGKYISGIEDSVWTFYNNNEISSIKKFENGELVKIESYVNSNLVCEEEVKTRYEVVKAKYLHLTLISLSLIGLIILLALNYRKSKQADIPKLSNLTKILGTIVLPINVLVVSKLISSIIPTSFSIFFISLFFELFFSYVVLIILFLIVFYSIKLRTRYDLLIYILLFALTLVFIEELFFLRSIISEM